MSIVQYTCANQIEAQKLFTTAQIYAVCPIHALDCTDHTGLAQLPTTQVLHNYDTIEHIIPYNAAKRRSPTGQSSTGFRYPPLLSPPSRHQVKSEALSLLLA